MMICHKTNTMNCKETGWDINKPAPSQDRLRCGILGHCGDCFATMKIHSNSETHSGTTQTEET